MKKIFLCALLMLSLPVLSRAQDDDFGVWGWVKVNKSFDNGVYAGLRGEYRLADNCSATDCWFFRPTVGYKVNGWLKFDVSYDYLQNSDVLQHRMLLGANATLKSGNFDVSVYERYVYSYTVENEKSGNTLRSKLTVSYQVPSSICKPYMAVEMFTWDKWKKTRQYVGCKFNFTEHHALDVFYMYYTFANQPAQQHLVGVGYEVKL